MEDQVVKLCIQADPLEHVWLPYRSQGLREEAYIEVMQDANSTGKFRFGSFVNQSGKDVAKGARMLKELFEIPPRWSKEVDRMGEMLVSEMRSHVSGLPQDVSDEEVWNHLEILKRTMVNERMARAPWAYPKYHLLAKYIELAEPQMMAQLRPFNIY